jgi:hypothetical protein
MQTVAPVEESIPDLELPGPKGSKLSLLSLDDKYVLLSFWSVKQPESVQNVLALKKIYQKYNNKGFEIYQVALEKSIPKWKGVLAFEEIEWVSVCDTAYPNSKTRSYYNVNSVPMNYLIDMENQEILLKNVSPSILDKNLEYLLK